MSLRRGHTVELLQCGAEFFPSLVAAIDGSRSEVRLETYIFLFDSVGQAVAAALERAALRGVAVYVVVDGIGTPSAPLEDLQRLRAAGVQWHQFSPLGTLGLLIPGRWRRLHRKLCVVDGSVLLCGGINILDDHFEFDHGVQPLPRLDFAVRVTGPLVGDAQATMQQLWRRLELSGRLGAGWVGAAPKPSPSASPRTRSGPSAVDQAAPHPQAWLGASGQAVDQGAVQATGGQAAAQSVVHSVVHGAGAALVLRDNLRNRSRIERAYRQAIAHAKEEVVIANAYFVPGAKLRRALVHAAQRGVRVQLLLQGRYEYFMQFHAAKPYYNILLAAGVEIHEYQAGFLHAKVAVIDGKWATVGSSNLDPLSLLLAREANVVVHDAVFAQTLLARLREAITDKSLPLERNAFERRPWRQRAKDVLGYWVMRATLFLTGTDY
jgi:cardiolipin synthase